MSMGGHQSAAMLKDEWLTPPEIIKALGPFDLDPCAPVNRPWETAAKHYTVLDNGLTKPWHGRVWCPICNSFKGDRRADMHYVRGDETSNPAIFSAAKGNEKRPEVQLPGLREGPRKAAAESAQRESFGEDKAPCGEESASSKRERESLETAALLYRQQQTEAEKTSRSDGMDCSRLGGVPVGVGEPLRILRQGRSDDSGSLHPAVIRGMPRNNTPQHGASLSGLQYQQASKAAELVGERQVEACPDCGLPTEPAPESVRVFCNPPYGAEAGRWLARCADHGNAIALIFARTETTMFVEHVWRKADALLFIHGRLHFHHVDGSRAAANAGAPSVLVAYGRKNAEVLAMCGIKGAFVPWGMASL